MKTIKLLLIGIIGLMIIGCSSDDEGDSFNFIPSGEIVPIELRNITLTGFDESPNEGPSPKDLISGQKWWVVKESDIFFDGSCPGDEETEVFLEEAKSQLKGAIGNHVALTPDGSILIKINGEGEPFLNGSWEWTDESKEAILISSAIVSGELDITYLNDENLVYGNVQSEAGCSLSQFLQFNEPYEEK